MKSSIFTLIMLFCGLAHAVKVLDVSDSINKPLPKSNLTIRLGLIEAFTNVAFISSSVTYFNPLEIGFSIYNKGNVYNKGVHGYMVNLGYTIPWRNNYTENEKGMINNFYVLAGYHFAVYPDLDESDQIFQEPGGIIEKINYITFEFGFDTTDWINRHFGLNFRLNAGAEYAVSGSSSAFPLFPIVSLLSGIAF